jgi:hypothetical protein
MVGEFRPTETIGAAKSILLEKKIDAAMAGQLSDFGAIEHGPTEEFNAPRKVNLVAKGQSDTSSRLPLV